MILGHRLSELCGHGPSLETDIALTNISLDFFGQVRNYFQYAATLKPAAAAVTEDSIAFLRYPHEYKNVLLVEQPNKNFAYVIARQFLFDAYHLPLLDQLTNSRDTQIAAIADKSIKETKYHLRFSSEWVKRLGDGTLESHRKIRAAMNYLYPYTAELFEATPIEKTLQDAGIGADLEQVSAVFLETVDAILQQTTIELNTTLGRQSGGKKGVHTEHLGYILSDLQYMQRTYPNMKW